MIGITKILDQVNKIQVKSITDPLFKYSAILFSFGAITSVFKVDYWVIIVLFSIAVLLLLVGLFFYFYFCFKNPDYLRSESFQLKKRTIEMLGDKENKMNPNIKELKFIASPFSNQLEENNNNDFGKKNE